MGGKPITLLADIVASYVKACGKRSILQTRPQNLKNINFAELKYMPNIQQDVVQITPNPKLLLKPVKYLSYEEHVVEYEKMYQKLLKEGFTIDEIGAMQIPRDKFANIHSFEELFLHLKNERKLPHEQIFNILESSSVGNYLEFIYKDLETMTITEKKALIKKLIEYKNYNRIKGDLGKELFPCLPRNEEEMIKIIEKISSDITINIGKMSNREQELFIKTLNNYISKLQTGEKCIPNEIYNVINQAYLQMGRQAPSSQNLHLLEDIVNDKTFQKLSSNDKLIVALSTLLSKKTTADLDVSDIAYEAMSFAKHLNLDNNSVERIFNIVKNADAPKRLMESSNILRGLYGTEKEVLLESMALDLRNFNDFELAKLLYKQKYPHEFIETFNKTLAAKIEKAKYSFSLPQTSLRQLEEKAKIVQFVRGDKIFNIPVVRASSIDNFCGYLHTPDAGMTSGMRAFKPNTVNFEYFSNPISDELICANYVGGGKYYPTGYQGFFMQVSPTKQYLAESEDLWSMSRNLDDYVENYVVNTHPRSTRNPVGDDLLCYHFDELSSNDVVKEYVQRLEKLKANVPQEEWTIENIEKVDKEFAQAYKRLLSCNDEYGGALIRPKIPNEALIKNPQIAGIYSINLENLPVEYLEEAEKKGYTIIDLMH